MRRVHLFLIYSRHVQIHRITHSWHAWSQLHLWHGRSDANKGAINTLHPTQGLFVGVLRVCLLAGRPEVSTGWRRDPAYLLSEMDQNENSLWFRPRLITLVNKSWVNVIMMPRWLISVAKTPQALGLRTQSRQASCRGANVPPPQTPMLACTHIARAQTMLEHNYVLYVRHRVITRYTYCFMPQ